MDRDGHKWTETDLFRIIWHKWTEMDSAPGGCSTFVAGKGNSTNKAGQGGNRLPLL